LAAAIFDPDAFRIEILYSCLEATAGTSVFEVPQFTASYSGIITHNSYCSLAKTLALVSSFMCSLDDLAFSFVLLLSCSYLRQNYYNWISAIY